MKCAWKKPEAFQVVKDFLRIACAEDGLRTRRNFDLKGLTFPRQPVVKGKPDLLG